MSDTEWIDVFNRQVKIDFWANGQPNNKQQSCIGVDSVGMSDVFCEDDSRKIHAFCELPKIN